MWFTKLPSVQEKKVTEKSSSKKELSNHFDNNLMT